MSARTKKPTMTGVFTGIALLLSGFVAADSLPLYFSRVPYNGPYLESWGDMFVAKFNIGNPGRFEPCTCCSYLSYSRHLQPYARRLRVPLGVGRCGSDSEGMRGFHATILRHEVSTHCLVLHILHVWHAPSAVPLPSVEERSLGTTCQRTQRVANAWA